MRTSDGELIPRGPVGKRSVYVTYAGNIINLDTEGLPVQKGPKPEVLTLEVDPAGDPIHPEATTSDPLPSVQVSAAAQAAGPTREVEPVAEVAESAKQAKVDEITKNMGGLGLAN